MAENLSRIYGYARASDPKIQCLSIDRQHDTIEQKAQQLAEEIGATLVHIRTDGVSAKQVRHDKRDEFRKLMDELEPGDHLIIWRLDRLDRSLNGLAACLDWLHRRGVVLHVLDHGDLKMDLDSANGRLMANILACVASFQSDQQSEAIRSALQWCKQNGLAYHGKTAIGKKRIHFPARKGERRGRVMDVWDEKECRQIREIVSRYEAGETLHAIGLDFLARDERTAMGARWVRPAGGYKRTGRRRTRPDDSRVYRAYHYAKQLAEQGIDLGDTAFSSASPSGQ